MSTSPETKIVLAHRGWIIQSIPFLVTLTALCLTITSVASCHFMLVENMEGLGLVGLFRFGSSNDEMCSTYRHSTALINNYNDENNPDKDGLSTAHQAAQAGGILASLFGFTCTMLLFLSFCFRCLSSKAVWRFVLPILLLLTSAFQGMTFALFGDCKDTCEPEVAGGPIVCNVTTCSFSAGANRALAAMMLYFFMGIGIIFFPRRSTPLFELVADHDYETVATNSGTSSNLGVVNSRKMDTATRVVVAEQHYRNATPDIEQPSPRVVSEQQRTAIVAPISAPTAYAARPTTTPMTAVVEHAVVEHERDDDEGFIPMTNPSSVNNHQQQPEGTMMDQSSSSSLMYDESGSSRNNTSHSLLDPQSSGSNRRSSPNVVGDDGALSPPRPRKHRKKKRPSKPRREEADDTSSGIQPATRPRQATANGAQF
mmetsp:Transcript_26476/g.44208  ORF Transcript_26476/g.44208 Transcript_26476/m.44208 type:complete len:427 (-) Transcript_26476:132-1412(-)